MTDRLLDALYAAAAKSWCWLLDHTTERTVTRFANDTHQGD